MADIVFKLSAVSGAYPFVLQRRAVLHPLAGWQFRGAQSVAAYALSARRATAQVVRIRRARLSQLASAGWYPGATPLHSQYVRNCLPAFTYALPRFHPCDRWWCPFCHARRAAERWARLDAAFTAFDRPCWLVLRSRTATVAHRAEPNAMVVSLHGLFRQLAAQRSWAFELAGDVYGGAAFATIAPGPGGWHVRHRQLFLVPEGYVLPEALLQTGGVGHLHTHTYEQPTRRIFMEAVSRLLRYPAGLLHSPDLAQLIALLQSHVPARVTDLIGRPRVQRASQLYAAKGVLY